MIKDTVYKNEVDFSKINRLNPKQIEKIKNYISRRPHEIYGSFQASSWGSSLQRRPADLDIQVNDVKKTQEQMKQILKQSGYSPRIHFYPEYNSQQVTLRNNATGEWDQIVDIQPLEEHQNTKMENTGKRSIKPIQKDGYTIQHPLDQLNRKENSVKNKNMPKHRVEKDTFDYVRTQTDLIESEKVKRNAQYMRGDLETAKKHKKNMSALGDPVTSSMVAMSKYKYKVKDSKEVRFEDLFANKRTLQKANIDPIPQKAEKQFYEQAKSNPNVSLDDIDVDSQGNVYVKGKMQNSNNKNIDSLIKR